VIDLGCWPGGWLQVVSRTVGARGRVVGVDLAETEALEDCANVFVFCGDFTEQPVINKLLELAGGPTDVLLSDAAPKVTGVRAVDRAREEALLEAIEFYLPQLLKPGGSLLFKLFECPEAKTVEDRLRRRFEKCKRISPKASRKGSKELYFYARGYAGAAPEPA
jgi:23S rRNA (uridine2552-2'-O)-methyltransferase